MKRRRDKKWRRKIGTGGEKKEEKGEKDEEKGKKLEKDSRFLQT